MLIVTKPDQIRRHPTKTRPKPTKILHVHVGKNINTDRAYGTIRESVTKKTSSE